MYKKKIKIGIIVGLEREKKLLNKTDFLIVEAGYNKNAIGASKKVLKNDVDVVVSFGLAGSIDKNLKNGEIIIPSFIVNHQKKRFTSEKFSKLFISILNIQQKFNQGLYTSNKIENLNTLNKLNKIKNVSAVDMESFYILEESRNKKIPFCCIRVIFDDLDFNIPRFISKSIDGDGKVIFKKLIEGILKEPQNIKFLFVMFKYYLRAKTNLKKVSRALSDINGQPILSFSLWISFSIF